MNTERKNAVAQIIQEICDQGARLVHYIQSRITAMKDGLKNLILFVLKGLLQLLVVLKLMIVGGFVIGTLSFLVYNVLKFLFENADVQYQLADKPIISYIVYACLAWFVGGVLWKTYSLRPEDTRKTLALRVSLIGFDAIALFAINPQLSPLGWFVTLEGFEYIRLAVIIITAILLLEVLIPALIEIAARVAAGEAVVVNTVRVQPT